MPPTPTSQGALQPAPQNDSQAQTRQEDAQTFHLIFQPSGRRGSVLAGVTLLEAAQRLGVGIQSLCAGAQTCGRCRVHVEEGHFGKEGVFSSLAHTSPCSAREEAYMARHEFGPRERFACEARVLGDLVIFVPETSRTEQQIIRKTATERVIPLDPAIRLCYVRLTEPTLADEAQGDLERVLAALEERFGLTGLHIDYQALRTLQPALRQGEWGITLTIWQDREIIRVQPGFHDRAIGLAVDIGTTSVAGYLCNLETGEVLATESAMNPQVAYGEDVMSRISYVMEHGAEGLATLHTAIVNTLNELAQAATARVGLEPEDIAEVVLVGNTVMHHLALNLNPVYLGGTPFRASLVNPVNVKARELGLAINPAANVHVLPVKAGYVGADNMGVILAEAPHEQDEVTLIIDVGTNGEILLGSRERLLSASSPTGPAFEGAQITFGMRAAEGAIDKVRIDPGTLTTRFQIIGREGWSDAWAAKEPGEPSPSPDGRRRHSRPHPSARGAVLARGICGSGIIDAVAEMFRARILLPSGAFNPGIRHERIVTHRGMPAFVIAPAAATAIGQDIVVTLADVRAVQLAKAALYTGCRILMRELGVSQISRVVLAGAFGSYIDKYRAMILGLFPDCDPENVQAVGNAAGDGARIALLNRSKREEIARLARWVEHVLIPMDEAFQELYLQALNLPHAADPFPHVEAWLQGEVELA